MARTVEREPVRFEGFGSHALEFFERLSLDNTKAFWLEHRAQYEVEVGEPLHALAGELALQFGEPKVFRPYRDVRFSADKTPYKEHASFGFFGAAGVGGGGGLYFELSTEGLLLAGGLYSPARDQLERFRDLQDDPKAVAGLDALLQQLADAGFPLGEGAPLKTAPRGRSVEHPRIEFLRRTMLTVSHTFDVEPWLFERVLLDEVAQAFSIIERWNAWIRQNVGPSDKPLRAW